MVNGGKMKNKILALLDVTGVFLVTMLAIVLVGASQPAGWVRQVTHRTFLEYLTMIAVPLVILLVSKRNLSLYGLSFRNMRYHINITLIAFIPVAVSCVFFSFLSSIKMKDALILVVIQVALLFVLGFILRKKPTLGDGVLAGFVFLGFSNRLAAGALAGNAISAVIFYVLFLGFAEEFLFRGYIQSRLNIAFGKPFKFFGVTWGWGAIIASVLFGLMHVLNVASLVSGHWILTPWWGVWTFFSGLVFAFIREKTGSIVAPALLHGLPQGIAYAFMGM